jgi:hypothetical protein
METNWLNYQSVFSQIIFSRPVTPDPDLTGLEISRLTRNRWQRMDLRLLFIEPHSKIMTKFPLVGPIYRGIQAGPSLIYLTSIPFSTLFAKGQTQGIYFLSLWGRIKEEV